ncbi:MAG: hypothetical protein JST82_13885 [Bacteroidetes bacterium]|nr:hypothetical protein [Bacteroidota bacterium]
MVYLIQNYYPYGMKMPGRLLDGDSTNQYGYNGKRIETDIYKSIDPSLAKYGVVHDYGERLYNSRLGQFPTPDPLFKKYPGVSPYTYAGDNPIWNIDRKGLTKTTYTVIVFEQTGQTLINRTTTAGLKPISYTSMDAGIRTYDWHDYSVYNITTIGKDGKVTTSSTTKMDGFRTNTFSKSEGYAEAKLSAGKFFSGLGEIFKPTKETSVRDGWVLTTSSKLFPGNDHNLNAVGRGQFVDADAISSAFGVASAANTEQGAETLKDLLIYAKDAINGAGSAQGLAPIKLSNGNDTFNCDVEGGCGQLHVKDNKGNTQVAIPVPNGKTKEDYHNH